MAQVASMASAWLQIVAEDATICPGIKKDFIFIAIIGETGRHDESKRWQEKSG